MLAVGNTAAADNADLQNITHGDPPFLARKLFRSANKIVEKIHNAKDNFDGIVINAGAYTHTSVAIRDALSSVNVPAVEVHITNIYKREEFRHHSYLAPVCIGQISGFGLNSYKLGLKAVVDYLSDNNE